jgi:hypothetical protein
MTSEPSSGCRNWPTPSKQLAAAMPVSWRIAEGRGRMSVAVGWWI